MHRSWRVSSGLKVLALVFGAVAMLALCINGAWAANIKVQDSGPLQRYVLMSTGTWGAAQDAAIRSIGGTVQWSHAASGLGVATSSDPYFVTALLSKGLFASGSADMTVQWQPPVREQLGDDDVSQESVMPGNDRFINLLWNMQAIDAPGAWSAGYDGSGVRVAVIDGGMCSLHPDVAPNIDTAASRSFVAGFNWYDDTGSATSFRHACHVAGIIAAVDNTIGTIGVAPKATIISCKALHGGSGTFEAVIAAILYASDPISAGGAGANIINMSLGATFARGGGNTGAGALIAAMNQAVNYATANNVLCVSSAGNSALDLDHSGSIITIPAESGSGIAVSATAPQDYFGGGSIGPKTPASYTNFGNSAIWVAAPGGDFAYPGNENCTVATVSPPGTITRPCWVFDGVLSPGSQSGSYFWASGTSMAAPHVSGVAALIVQKYPGILVGDLKALIAATAEAVSGSDPLHPYYGRGFLNAHNAVTSGSAPQAAASPTPKLETAAASRVELVIARNGGAVPEISFTLPSAGQARVDLFDVAGRKVAVLYSGQANAGLTRVAWDGRDGSGSSVRQGAYFARLTANGVQQARQIVLLGQ